MSELNDMKISFEREARLLGDYEKMSKSDLANGYCDAEEVGDSAKKSQYFSALLLRYWYKIYEWQGNSASLRLDPTDFVEWLVDSLQIAFRYKAWRNPESSMYNDPDGPDKVINRCCFSARGRAYQYHNKDKRKANVQVSSIDASTDDVGDCALDYMGCTTPGPGICGANEIVELFLKTNRTIEALIIDGIAHQDSFKTIKTPLYKDDIDSQGRPIKRKYHTVSEAFDGRKLVKHLTSINQEFMDNYFCAEYNVSQEVGNAILTKLQAMTGSNNSSLYRYIKKTLIEIKEDPNLLSLCID